MALSADGVVQALPGLYRYALMLARDPERAEDLVQDTVAKALASADSFRGEATADTWLHVVMYRTYVDGIRREREHPWAEEQLAAAVEAAWQDESYRVSPELVVERARDREALLDALVRLPHAYRAAVLLHDVEGWTAARIAAAHEISLPAAKQRIRRGRAQLISALDGAVERRLALKGVPMTCWDARALVSDYLDGDLDVTASRELEQHLTGCPTCPSLYAALVGVHDTLGALRDADSVVPPDLASRVRRHLSSASTQAPADQPTT